MDGQIVCEGCLSYIPYGKTECPYCGHSFANTNPTGAIAIGTLLHGYTICKCIELDSESVSYSAIRNDDKKSVIIKEFAPASLCCARDEEGLLVPRSGKEVLFKTIRMDYKELYSKLQLLCSEEGLVSVLDVFDFGDTTYGVLEKAEPHTLRDYLAHRKTPMSASEAVALLRPVSCAVRAMHRIGLVHRGISPDTVYITSLGQAKLGGYATLGMRTKGSELTSRVFDGFSAPEQYSIAEFDGPYTDIYALGALHYLAVTGQTPIAADKRKASDDLPAANKIAQSTPAYISSAISRAMRLAASERMQSADAFIHAISGTHTRDNRRFTTAQRTAIACAAAILCVMLALAIFIMLTLNAPKPAPPASDISSGIVNPPIVFTVPNFIGKQYQQVQTDEQYVGKLVFAVEEEYSSSFRKGEIMEQAPIAGTEPGDDHLVKLKVSRGPQTATMPDVLGMPRQDAKALLDTLKIKYAVIPIENNGDFLTDTVAKTDIEAGTEIEIDNESVVLYVANELKGESSSVPDISVSTITPIA